VRSFLDFGEGRRIANEIRAARAAGASDDEALVDAVLLMSPGVAEEIRAAGVKAKKDTLLIDIAMEALAPRLPLSRDAYDDACLELCDGDIDSPVYPLLMRLARYEDEPPNRRQPFVTRQILDERQICRGYVVERCPS